jgi:hypothetical protein
MNQYASQQYDSDEVTRIIRRAFHFKAVYLAKPQRRSSKKTAWQKRANCMWAQNN